MTTLKHISLAAVSAAAILSACSGPDKWTLNGSIEGATNKHIAIEAAENGIWLPIDTLSTDADGKFSYSRAPMGYPDILRLSMDGKYIYFPIDSVETLSLTTSADNFTSDAVISGSESAERIQTVDRRIKKSVDSLGLAGALSDSLLKRDLSQMILSDPAGIVSYYIICKQIGNKFLFDPTISVDNRVLGAVANSFSEKRPDDPRTRFLKSVYLKNRPAGKGHTEANNSFEVKEVDFFDIALTDDNGLEHKLSDAVSKNKVVLLNFTIYGTEVSPALNVALGEAYGKYHDNGFEIYQIALDENELYWKQSAKNLPWITVYNPPVSPGSGKILTNYNVQAVPASFLIVNGQLQERVDDYENLSSIIAKNL